MTPEQSLRKASYHIGIFAMSKFVSVMGANIVAFGISLYILKLTGSATSFSINILCSIIPRVLFSPLIGYMADRYNKKVLVISSQILTVVTVAILLLYANWQGMSIMAIYIMMVFYTIFTSCSGITLTASIGQLVDQDRIQKVMSLNQLSMSLAAIGAPMIGGILYGFVSIEVFLIIQIIAFSISTLLDATMNFNLYKTEKNHAQKSEPFLKSMKSAYHYIKNRKTLKTIITLALCLNLFFSAFAVGISYVLVEVVQFKSLHVGWIESIGAVGMLLASIYLTARKNLKNPILFSKRALLILSMMFFLFALPLILFELTYIQLFIYYGITSFLMTMTEVCTNVPIGVILQKSIEESYRGRVFALFETLAMGMMPFGILIYGFLYDYFGAPSVLIGTGIIVISLTLYLLRTSVLKQMKEEQLNENSQEDKFAEA